MTTIDPRDTCDTYDTCSQLFVFYGVYCRSTSLTPGVTPGGAPSLKGSSRHYAPKVSHQVSTKRCDTKCYIKQALTHRCHRCHGSLTDLLLWEVV